jgi:hypothetical protein
MLSANGLLEQSRTKWAAKRFPIEGVDFLSAHVAKQQEWIGGSIRNRGLVISSAAGSS